MTDLRSALRGEIALRQRIDDLLPFGAAGQAILLDLALCRIEGRKVSILDACIASNAPETTALRYIGLLVQAGLAYREPDPSDGRRVWLRITDDGFAAVQTVFGRGALELAA